MTSKEKAVNLFNKYYVSILEINNDLSEEIIISVLAKKQALIAVDEIRDNLPLISEIQQHWIDVKKELTNL